MQVLLLEKQFASELKHIAFSIARLKEALSARNISVISSDSLNDAKIIIKTNVPIDCFILTKTLTEVKVSNDADEVQLINLLYERQPHVPIFLLSDTGNITQKLDLELFKKINEFIWILEDSLEFVIGRIVFSMRNYKKNLFSPLITELDKYRKTYEYSWVIPGHQGGVGLRKTSAGRMFFEFFGENLFQADLNSARMPLGSLLGHSGAFKESEENISRIFGSDVSYSGVVGGSGSNKTVMQFCIKEGEKVVIDRNCHKSVTHGLILTGADPIYMKPSRNQYGIIGPVSIEEMEKAVKNKGIKYSVVTNCTFDGITYNSKKIENIMKDIPYVHLDEAWFAYARFNRLYENMYCMRGDPAKKDNTSTIFATHSSHKLLNALSQGSYIHIRSGTGENVQKLDPEKFNQYYMMHTTTSPSYIIAASNDIAAHMMDGDIGNSITTEMITEAVYFRKSLARLYNYYQDNKDWFFKPWNAEKINGQRFEEIPSETLIKEQSYWMLNSGDDWHGFDKLDNDWAMLDPIKVSVITPGINKDYSFQDRGIPAPIVCAWLSARGVIPCRFTDYQIIFLFTPGITKGKWGTLIDHFLKFKEQYDQNTSLKIALPDLYAKHEVYQNIRGLRDLCDRMFEYLKQPAHNLSYILNQAFDQIPKMIITPKKAFQSLTDASTEFVSLDQLPNRTSATTLIPYPPGIPMIIPGEQFGDINSPHIQYLKALEQWDKDFPGFEHETTGVKNVNGHYQVCVLSK